MVILYQPTGLGGEAHAIGLGVGGIMSGGGGGTSITVICTESINTPTLSLIVIYIPAWTGGAKSKAASTNAPHPIELAFLIICHHSFSCPTRQMNSTKTILFLHEATVAINGRFSSELLRHYYLNDIT
jgi:hypothetical protein